VVQLLPYQCLSTKSLRKEIEKAGLDEVTAHARDIVWTCPTLTRRGDASRQPPPLRTSHEIRRRIHPSSLDRELRRGLLREETEREGIGGLLPRASRAGRWLLDVEDGVDTCPATNDTVNTADSDLRMIRTICMY
jgi:hypothetical protein